MKLNKLFLIVVILIIPIKNGLAQIEVAKIWNTLTININSNNYRFYLEPQLRVQDAPNPLDQFLNNIGVGYRVLPSLTVWVGTTSLIIGSLTANVPDRTEFRTWQQSVLAGKVNQYNLQLRSRLEERRRDNFSALNYRFRNRLTINRPFYKSLNWVWYDEFFINLNRPIWITSNTIEQNRFLIGINQKASKTFTVGVGYLNQYIFTKPRIIGHVASLFAQIEIDG